MRQACDRSVQMIDAGKHVYTARRSGKKSIHEPMVGRKRRTRYYSLISPSYMAAENKYNKQKLDTRNKKYKRSVAGKIQPAKCIIII